MFQPAGGGGGTGNAILLPAITGASFSTVEDMNTLFHSAGLLIGGTFTSNGDGTAKVGAGSGFIRSSDSSIAQLFFVSWAEVASLSLTDNADNHVYLAYNGGSPGITVSTTMPTDINTNVLIGNIYRAGTTLHLDITERQNVGDHAALMIKFNKEVMPFAHASGAAVAATGTRNFSVTSGVFWNGLTRVVVPSSTFDSSGTDRFTYWYFNGSAWVSVASQSQIDNTQYNNIASGLATLTTNRYGVHWIYLEDDGHVDVIYGQGDYTLALAQSAARPATLPDLISATGTLIAKIIIQKSAAAFTSIDSAFTTPFPTSTPVNHNDLANIQGGNAAASERYHQTLKQNSIGAQIPKFSVIDGASALFDADTGSWAGFAEGAVAVPVDLTGGSPTVVTFARGTAFDADGNLRISHSAANGQGEGLSVLTQTVQPKWFSSVFDIEFRYQTSSSYADNQLELWVYDVTNSTLIQPSTYQILASTSAKRFKAQFQTSATGTSYRIGFFCPNTTATAYTIDIDSIRVGPSVYNFGAAVTDWTSFTPVCSWNTGVNTPTGKWRRSGDTLDCECYVTCSGAPTSSALIFTIPSGMTIDTTKIADNTQNDGSNCFGYGAVLDSGNNSFPVRVALYSTTQLLVKIANTASTYATDANVTQAVPITFGASDSVSIRFSVPILGWSSSVQMSDQADQRVTAAILTGDPASATSGNPIIVPTITYDSHNAYNASTGRYTVSTPGLYQMFGSLQSASSATTLTIYKNAISYALCGNLDSNGEATFTGLVQCNANDIIDIRPGGTVDATNMVLNIVKIQGPSAIGATESVGMMATKNSGTQTSNGALQDVAAWNAPLFDTHGQFNTTTGIYTCAAKGRFVVIATIAFGSSNGTVIYNEIVKNSTSLCRGPAITGGPSNGLSSIVMIVADCVFGDTLKVQCFQNSGGNLNYNTTAGASSLSIFRLGI